MGDATSAISSILSDFAREHGDRIDQVAYCRAGSPLILVASASQHQVKETQLTNDASAIWNALVRFLSEEADGFVLAANKGGIAAARTALRGAVLIQFRVGAQLGVFSALSKSLAAKVSENETRA